MTNRPGFKVTRVEVEDDDVITIESIASEGSALDELLATFDELKIELDKNREAKDILHRENVRLRDELATVNAELRTLKTENELRRLGFVQANDNPIRTDEAGRRFVSDGRGGEIEIAELGDRSLTPRGRPE